MIGDRTPRPRRTEILAVLAKVNALAASIEPLRNALLLHLVDQTRERLWEMLRRTKE